MRETHEVAPVTYAQDPLVGLQCCNAARKFAHWYDEPGGSVHGERANFAGLVLGCIEGKFRKKICGLKLSPRSAQCTHLHRFGIQIQKRGEKRTLLAQNKP